jgi:hypothetical protein
MADHRLGDVIDDHCIKCRRVTNHSIVSIVNGEAAKVRCRTCYHDHDYRHEQAPPSKKELKKMELFKEVLSSVSPISTEPEPVLEEAVVETPAPPVEEKKKARTKKA